MELCVFPNALPCVIVPVKRGHKGGCCHKQDTAEGKGKHCHSRFFLILGKVHYAKSKRSKAAAHFLVCGLFHIVLRHIAKRLHRRYRSRQFSRFVYGNHRNDVNNGKYADRHQQGVDNTEAGRDNKVSRYTADQDTNGRGIEEKPAPFL